MSRTPNYRTTDDYSFYTGSNWGDSKMLPAGSYVRPIELGYVPKHVLEDKRWSLFDKSKDVFVYSKLGIVMIPLRILRDE
jgi:hypothetical protein